MIDEQPKLPEEPPAVSTTPVRLGQWDKISATKLNTFRSCAYKYWLRYVMKVKEPPNAAMLRGTAVHKVLERFFEDKFPFDKKAGFYELQFQERVDKLLDEEWDNNAILAREPDMKEETGEALDLYITAFARKFMKLLKKGKGPAWAWKIARPDFNEKELKTDKFICYLDQVNTNEDTGKITITDLKTSSVFGDGFNEEYLFQITLYAMVYELVYNTPVHYGVIDYILFLQKVQFEITKERKDYVKRVLDEFEKVMLSKDEALFPRNPDTPFCQWCFYGNTNSPETNQPYCNRKRPGESIPDE